MKVILNICGVCFIARNSVVAARVADALGAMKPISREFLEGDGGVLVEGHDRYQDALKLEQFGSRKLWPRKVFEAEKLKQQTAAQVAEKKRGAR